MFNKIALGSLVCAVAIIGIVGYSIFKQRKYEASLIKEITPVMEETERFRIEKKLTGINDGLAQATEDNDRYDLLLDKGKILMDLGKLADARSAYREAISINSEYPGGYSGLSDVQVAMGDIKGAHKSLVKILSFNTSSIYWIRLIDFEINHLQANRERVEDLYTQALKSTEEHPSIIISFARYQEQQGDTDEALSLWGKAKEKDPENAAEYDAEINRINQSTQGQG